jgi:hypothetical protein
MMSQRVLDVILTVLAWIVLPVQLVTTLVLGIFVSISFGVLLVPISTIWMLLILPLLGASWLCSRIEVLRNPIGLVGIPWAVVANTYASLMPSMGELESRAAKLMLTESWPFCWEFWRFQTGRLDVASIESRPLSEIFERVTRRDPLKGRTLNRLLRHEQLDSHI